MKEHIKLIGSAICAVMLVAACIGMHYEHDYSIDVRPPEIVTERLSSVEYVEIKPNVMEISEEEKTLVYFKEADASVKEIEVEEEFLNLTFEEMDLLQQLAMVEARGEDAIGQALVMRTVINRSTINGTSIKEEIFKSGQFSTLDIGKYEPNEANSKAIAMILDGWNETMLETEEEWDRSKRVFYFGADGYPAYGEPAFCYGGHYFSVR